MILHEQEPDLPGQDESGGASHKEPKKPIFLVPYFTILLLRLYMACRRAVP